MEDVIRVVLFVKNPKTFDRFTLLKWYFYHLFRPCPFDKLQDYHFQVLDIQLKNTSKTVQITTKTEIILVSDRMNCVFLLDVSPSMKSAQSQILLSLLFEAICKMLNGISKTFQIRHSLTGEITTVPYF